MPVGAPIPGLSLGISPSSSAYSGTGPDLTGDTGGHGTGAVNFGGDDRWGRLAETAIVLAVCALGARYLWGKLK